MILGTSRQQLTQLGERDLIIAITERRNSIREHRDQKLDDRCWVDDYSVWKYLENSPAIPPLCKEQAMKRCELFYNRRREDFPDPMPTGALTDRKDWDADLFNKPREKMVNTLLEIQLAIYQHSHIPDKYRTACDDRALYRVLPERLPPDFRLPPREEFLGEAKAPNAGCPSFWRSHERCPGDKHNLHYWGPCRKRL
ncbi:MAG: hypothetical protein KW793_01695 [Candidatus Doudnabacteria bacterium]|nr:hypothetical protein [Candidatus Doudnabacteria bacterium]